MGLLQQRQKCECSRASTGPAAANLGKWSERHKEPQGTFGLAGWILRLLRRPHFQLAFKPCVRMDFTVLHNRVFWAFVGSAQAVVATQAKGQPLRLQGRPGREAGQEEGRLSGFSASTRSLVGPLLVFIGHERFGKAFSFFSKCPHYQRSLVSILF